MSYRAETIILIILFLCNFCFCEKSWGAEKKSPLFFFQKIQKDGNSISMAINFNNQNNLPKNLTFFLQKTRWQKIPESGINIAFIVKQTKEGPFFVLFVVIDENGEKLKEITMLKDETSVIEKISTYSQETLDHHILYMKMGN